MLNSRVSGNNLDEISFDKAYKLLSSNIYSSLKNNNPFLTDYTPVIVGKTENHSYYSPDMYIVDAIYYEDFNSEYSDKDDFIAKLNAICTKQRKIGKYKSYGLILCLRSYELVPSKYVFGWEG